MRTTVLSAAIACAITFVGAAGVATAADARTSAQALAERADLMADVRGGNGNNGNNGNHGNGNGNGNGRNASRGNRGNGGTPPGQVDRNSPSDSGSRGNSVPHRGGMSLRPGRTDLCPDNPLFGPLGQSGRSHVAHVAFHEVDVETGDPVDDGAWARMTYFWVGSEFSYVLNAHGVEPGSEHTLILQAEDDTVICLSEGTANPGGQLHLRDSIEPDAHLPPELDPFERPTDEDAGLLYLVPTDAVDCEAGTVDPALEAALASEHAVRFVDTDELECPEDEPEGG